MTELSRSHRCTYSHEYVSRVGMAINGGVVKSSSHSIFHSVDVECQGRHRQSPTLLKETRETIGWMKSRLFTTTAHGCSRDGRSPFPPDVWVWLGGAKNTRISTYFPQCDSIKQPPIIRYFYVSNGKEPTYDLSRVCHVCDGYGWSGKFSHTSHHSDRVCVFLHTDTVSHGLMKRSWGIINITGRVHGDVFESGATAFFISSKSRD